MGYTIEQLKSMYPIGTKVVPHSKSAGTSLSSCSKWKQAQSIGQSYLVVSGYDIEAFSGKKVICLNVDGKSGGANFYLPEDVEYYNEADAPKPYVTKQPFKVGDKVMLKAYDDVEDHWAINKYNWDEYAGKIQTISHVGSDRWYHLEGTLLHWHESAFITDEDIKPQQDYIKVKPGMKLKVGDKVMIRPEHKLVELYKDGHYPGITDSMKSCAGKIMTVKMLNSDETLRLVESPDWTWALDMFVQDKICTTAIPSDKLLPVGTKVKVRTDLTYKAYDGLSFVTSMDKFKGKVVTITTGHMVSGRTRYYIKEGCNCAWTNLMFEAIINTSKEEEEKMLNYHSRVSRLMTLLKEGQAFYSKNDEAGWLKFGCVISKNGQEMVVTGFKGTEDGKLTALNVVPFKVADNTLIALDSQTIKTVTLKPFNEVTRYGYEYLTKLINNPPKTAPSKKDVLAAKIAEAELKLAEMKKEVSTM
jgi:hypothetical protein